MKKKTRDTLFRNNTAMVVKQWDAQKADHFVHNLDIESISKIDKKT